MNNDIETKHRQLVYHRCPNHPFLIELFQWRSFNFTITSYFHDEHNFSFQTATPRKRYILAISIRSEKNSFADTFHDSRNANGERLRERHEYSKARHSVIAVYRVVKCELASTCKVHRSLWIIAWTWNKPRAPVLCGNDPLLSADHRSHARNITVGTIESTLRALYKLLCIAESTMQAAAVFIISVNVKRWFSYVFVACCPCCARLSVVGSLFSVLACLSLTGTGVYNVLKNNDPGLVCLLRSLPWLKVYNTGRRICYFWNDSIRTDTMLRRRYSEGLMQSNDNRNFNKRYTTRTCSH